MQIQRVKSRDAIDWLSHAALDTGIAPQGKVNGRRHYVDSRAQMS